MTTLYGDRKAPQTLPDWLSQSDLDYYVTEFQRTGFRGGINRYRNMDRDWAELAHLQGANVNQPALFIAGEKDPVLRFTRVEAMAPHVPNLRKTVLIPGCGHWTQQECPSTVNQELLGFLQSLSRWT
jgi:pimeloyl-ACP methyl ester carboxylesterase